jgi:hypothetical protein
MQPEFRVVLQGWDIAYFGGYQLKAGHTCQVFKTWQV